MGNRDGGRGCSIPVKTHAFGPNIRSNCASQQAWAALNFASGPGEAGAYGSPRGNSSRSGLHEG